MQSAKGNMTIPYKCNVCRSRYNIIEKMLINLSSLTCDRFTGIHFPRHLTPHTGTTTEGNKAVLCDTTLEIERDKFTNIREELRQNSCLNSCSNSVVLYTRHTN